MSADLDCSGSMVASIMQAAESCVLRRAHIPRLEQKLRTVGACGKGQGRGEGLVRLVCGIPVAG